MPLLLVDDRDGRILAEVQTEEEALRVLDAMGHASFPDYLCLVACETTDGSFVATERSVTIRPLA